MWVLARHGPADPARLGAPLQRRGPRRPARPAPVGAQAAPHGRASRPRLTAEQEAELVTAVERGPDPDRDGVVRWRRVDLRALIEARFAVRLHERTVGKVLRRLGL